MRVAVAASLVLLAVAGPARAADPCELAGKAAPGTCAPSEQDGQGCCPKRPPCPAGKLRGPKTRGRCCWPGQEWVGGRCALAPTSCPAGLFATRDDCVVPVVCDGGRAPTQDGLHCCWPGQRWEGASCRGAPASCPIGFVPSGADCVAQVTCTGGKVRTADGLRCCWLGQTWSGSACVGTPTCLDGYRPEGDDCVLRECLGGRVRVDGLHCCWPGQGWDDACTGMPTCPEGLFAAPGDRECHAGATLNVLVERPPIGLEVRLDGAPLALTGSLGMRVVGPGRHDLIATAPGFEPLVTTIDVPPGEPMVVPLTLVPLPEPRASLVPWIVTSGVVGVGAIIAGTVLATGAEGKRDDIRAAAEGGVVPAERMTQRQAQALEDEADTLASWGAASFVLGGVALATGGVLFALEMSAGEGERSIHEVRIAPRRGGGAVIWSGSW
ncbi:MAG: hypothetical protein IT385_22285 [Deltaproteobacteria bacterium]|nr:hypothetical protein [Deltaproteobacteria bacterium]